MCMKKQCSACQKEGTGPLPVSEFGKNRREEDGYARHCKAHAQHFNREHRKNNRDSLKAKKISTAKRGSIISNALAGWGVPSCESAG